jgi:uncharacterized protein YegL
MGLNEYGAEKIAARPLEFIWLLDVSGSMEGAKIQSLNFAIREAIPEMQKVASENVNAEVFVRAITFSSYAQWHISQRTPVSQFQWTDVQADGTTALGDALHKVASVLDTSAMPPRGLPPVLVLISDGYPTDDWNSGLQALLSKPWGKKAVKIAIAIGDDADDAILQKFIDNIEIKPLKAESAGQLTTYIKWASTQVLNAASATPSTNDARKAKQNVIIPAAPVSIIDPNTDIF